MSEPLRVAFVGEGPTDRVVVAAALAHLLAGRSFILRQLQPEESVPFGLLGTGWVGVYRWCKQAVVRSGGGLPQLARTLTEAQRFQQELLAAMRT